jgi:hypothetical protein
MNSEYLRRQAQNCLRIARSCFDLASAERLRLMAAEFNAKADEMDVGEKFTPHRANGANGANGASHSGGNNRS